MNEFNFIQVENYFNVKQWRRNICAVSIVRHRNTILVWTDLVNTWKWCYHKKPSTLNIPKIMYHISKQLEKCFQIDKIYFQMGHILHFATLQYV